MPTEMRPRRRRTPARVLAELRIVRGAEAGSYYLRGFLDGERVMVVRRQGKTDPEQPDFLLLRDDVR